MLIRLFSDVHNEFGQFDAPIIDDERDMVLVLAGDIGLADKPRTIGPFVHAMANRHRAVIYIAGNHEHYGSSFFRTLEKMRSSVGMCPEFGLSGPKVVGIPSNVHIIQNETIVVDDVAFVGATLWTDFNRNDAASMLAARHSLNDYNCIRSGTPGSPYKRKLLPSDVYQDHVRSKAFIFSEIARNKAEGRKVCVVSHHAPCALSIPDWFRGPKYHLLNGAYVSELGNDIADAQPDCWLHGHTHTSFDYMINTTRVVCNPRGYEGHELNDGFNPRLVIQI